MATESAFEPLVGHCTCKTITYSMLAPPLATHCCHCTWCQRETGTAFVLNSIIESSNFAVTSPTQPTFINIPSPSGKGQAMARCPTCQVAVYSHYAGAEKWTTFVKVGTLAEGSRQRVRPDVHIFTSTKVEWVDLSSERERGVPVFEEYYQKPDVWCADSLERFAILKEKMAAAAEAEKGGNETKT